MAFKKFATEKNPETVVVVEEKKKDEPKNPLPPEKSPI